MEKEAKLQQTVKQTSSKDDELAKNKDDPRSINKIEKQ